MRITIEFKDINEYLEFKQKVLPSKVEKIIDGNTEQLNLIDAMLAMLEYLISKD